MARLARDVYAEAYYEVVSATPDPAAYLTEAQEVVALLSREADYERVMSHPSVPKADKEALLDSVWRSRISDELLGLMHTLLDKEHYAELPAVLARYEELARESLGIGRASVYTAVPLTEKQQDRVRSKLIELTGYRSIEIQYVVRPEYIGGMAIRIGDRVIDNTIRTRIYRLQSSLQEVMI